jgi:hypothetical protein
MHPVRILMKRIIDYAGLFPPAELDMPSAVTNYATYRDSEAAWALGRFILPVSRLGEFEAAAQHLLPRYPAAAPWPLSALGTNDLKSDLAAIQAFNQGYAQRAIIDTIELKVSRPNEIVAAMRVLPEQITPYFEIPIADDPAELIATIGREGGRAKVRTGGTTQGMFPDPEHLLHFIGACVAAQVAFKATAGLHHPLRSQYRLTYKPDSERGMMYGFLNVFLSAAFLAAGMNVDETMQVLIEESSAAFQFDDSGIDWRGRRLTGELLANVRERLAISFGSCSFEEPIDELKAMKLL